jgi:hypothetical protein
MTLIESFFYRAVQAASLSETSVTMARIVAMVEALDL